jgi:hypothetical protein
MKLNKLRKKLRNKKFVLRLLRRFGEEENRLNHFKKFECDDFFRGYTLATLNRQIYDREIKKLKRKTFILFKALDRMNNNE